MKDERVFIWSPIIEMYIIFVYMCVCLINNNQGSCILHYNKAKHIFSLRKWPPHMQYTTQGIVVLLQGKGNTWDGR